MTSATSWGGVIQLIPAPSSETPRASAHPFQTWIGTPAARHLASSSASGGMPTPRIASAAPGRATEVASPASAMAASTPEAAAPLAAMWKGMLARVGSSGPVLEVMSSVAMGLRSASARAMSRPCQTAAMEAKTVLRFQLQGSFNQMRERLRAIDDREWDRRATPGTSKVGFILWHCARTIDWSVNCGVQGRPEVASGPSWRERLAAADGLFGAGIDVATADAVPGRVSRQSVLEYLDALEAPVLSWLDGLPPAGLEDVPDLRQHLATVPEYLAPGVWAEVGDFEGAPAWHYLARAAISHIRVHMGEVDALLEAMRQAAPAP